jgi:hypothetical protein
MPILGELSTLDSDGRLWLAVDAAKASRSLAVRVVSGIADAW